MKSFKFNLGNRVRITSSGEHGKIVGRAEYTNSENTYHLHYKCTDGHAVTVWWEESFLEALAPLQEQPEGSPTFESKLFAWLVQPVQTQPSAEVPKCMQCRHFKQSDQPKQFDRCLHPGHGVDPVRGFPMAPACELVRHASRTQTCGEAGQWFEASTA